MWVAGNGYFCLGGTPFPAHPSDKHRLPTSKYLRRGGSCSAGIDFEWEHGEKQTRTALQGGRASGLTHVPSQKAKEAGLDLSPTKDKTAAGGGTGTSFAERVVQKDCEIVLLAGEDSPPPKKRSVGEASEGEVHVVDKPVNTNKKTKWPP